MNDTIAGELLISFYAGGDVGGLGEALLREINLGQVGGVRYLEDLRTPVAQLGLPIRSLDFEFHKLGVPIGQETFYINYLQLTYQRILVEALNRARAQRRSFNIPPEPNYHLQVVPHAVLAIHNPTGAGGIGFSFAKTHNDYKQMFGWTAPTGKMNSKRVLVVDTGFDAILAANVVDQRNFIDNVKQKDATDDHGHGTAVLSVIYNLCPSAEFVIYKVADANGHASEWNTLAALAANSRADIVNLSLAFGLPDIACQTCGRESHSSRSAVFENMINQLAKQSPILIAAAGNAKDNQLAFPARFDTMIALESINLAGQLSEFTNRGDKDQKDNDHHNVFVLPGGEKPQNSAATEYIGTSASGDHYYGTSFSTAYASGIVAALWSDPANSNMDRAQLLDHLRKNANINLPNYQSSTHGNGMMKFI
jgi:hypothetical protein